MGGGGVGSIPWCCKARIECMAGSLSQTTRTNGETGGPEVAPGFMTLQMSLEDIPGYLVTN